MAPRLEKRKHAEYLQRLLQLELNGLEEFDPSRLVIAFFAVSGLDIMNCLDELSQESKFEIIEWIYMLQVKGAGARSGFQPSTTVPHNVPKYQCGHLAMTYAGLLTLLILGDDLSKVDRKSVIEGVRACQNPDGSFTAAMMGCESDMRFLYCACCISAILNDWSGIDKHRAIDYILQSVSYDGAIGHGPGLESHGGSTFCAIASLALMNELHNVLSDAQLNKLRRWCFMRQDYGFQGRPGKPSDTCYSFWICATLELLDVSCLLDQERNRVFLLNSQNILTGGLAKYTSCHPDPVHTYLGLCALSLLRHSGFLKVNPALNISDRAYQHLLKIQKEW